MQKIIDGKLYDTETAELLLTIGNHRPLYLYRTKKGAYFVNNSVTSFMLQTEDQAKDMLGHYGSVETYTRLFGAPEEA